MPKLQRRMPKWLRQLRRKHETKVGPKATVLTGEKRIAILGAKSEPELFLKHGDTKTDYAFVGKHATANEKLPSNWDVHQGQINEWLQKQPKRSIDEIWAIFLTTTFFVSPKQRSFYDQLKRTLRPHGAAYFITYKLTARSIANIFAKQGFKVGIREMDEKEVTENPLLQTPYMQRAFEKTKTWWGKHTGKRTHPWALKVENK